jgi:hypothetical protein
MKFKESFKISKFLLVAILFVPQVHAQSTLRQQRTVGAPSEMQGLYYHDTEVTNYGEAEEVRSELDIRESLQNKEKDIFAVIHILGSNRASCSIIGDFTLNRTQTAYVMTESLSYNGPVCKISISKGSDETSLKLTNDSDLSSIDSCVQYYCAPTIGFDGVEFKKY